MRVKKRERSARGLTEEEEEKCFYDAHFRYFLLGFLIRFGAQFSHIGEKNYTLCTVSGRNLLEHFGILPLVSCQVRQTHKKAHIGEEGFNFWNGPRGVGRKKEEEK